MIASLVVPVHATSWTTLVPADYIDYTYYDGNYRYVVYDFQRSSLIYYRYGSGTGTSKDYVRLSPNPDITTPFYFTAFPLGARSTGGPPLSNSASGQIAIDVSDFKSLATMTYMSNIQLELDISYFAYASAIDERLVVGVDWLFMAYGESGNYIGSIDRHQESISVTLQDVYSDGTSYIYDLPIDMDLVFSDFAETVSYIVPSCAVTVSTTYDEPDLTVSYIQFSCDGFTISARTDMLLKDSLTLQAIEDQLGDLNDKTDTLINGTPEQNQAAQDAKDEVLDFRDEAERIEDEQNNLLQNAEEALDDMLLVVDEAINGAGWGLLSRLLTPVMDFKYTGILMLLAIAFINMSIIMFGR